MKNGAMQLFKTYTLVVDFLCAFAAETARSIVLWICYIAGPLVVVVMAIGWVTR